MSERVDNAAKAKDVLAMSERVNGAAKANNVLELSERVNGAAKAKMCLLCRNEWTVQQKYKMCLKRLNEWTVQQRQKMCSQCLNEETEQQMQKMCVKCLSKWFVQQRQKCARNVWTSRLYSKGKNVLPMSERVDGAAKATESNSSLLWAGKTSHPSLHFHFPCLGLFACTVEVNSRHPTVWLPVARFVFPFHVSFSFFVSCSSYAYIVCFQCAQHTLCVLLVRTTYIVCAFSAHNIHCVCFQCA